MPDFEGTDGTGHPVPPDQNPWPGDVLPGTPNGVIIMQMLGLLGSIAKSLARIEAHLELITDENIEKEMR